MLPMSEGLYAGDDYGHYERVVREGRLVRMWGKYYKRLIADVDADYTGLCGLTYAEDLLQSMPLARAARSFSISRNLCTTTTAPTLRAALHIARPGIWMI